MSQYNTKLELSRRVGRPLLSVVIKTLNEELNIARAIESSLQECDGTEAEIIVADSASTDRTVEIAARFPVKVVRLADPTERCCGIGPQLGYQHARGEFIYILDGDMEFEPGFIRAALKRIREDPRLAGVAGTVTELGYGNYEFEQRRQSRASMLSGPQRWLGMGGLYRREALESVEYFSNRNLHAEEERELGLRLTATGWRMERMAVPAVRHFGHRDTTLQLVFKRWRNRYTDGTGELLRSSIGKPYFFDVLAQEAKLILLIGGWLFTACALLTVAWSVWPIGLAALFWLMALVIQSMRKGSFIIGTQSILFLQILTAGFVRGFLSEQVYPTAPIRSLVIKDPPTIWPLRDKFQKRVSEKNAGARRVLHDFSVIIPTVGRPILQRCLQSIADGTVLPARIIAIDQGDNPMVADWLHGLEETGLETYHLRSTERSPASARNRGLEQVQTPFVASVDDDCIVEKDWLEKMETQLHQHPAAIIAGRVEPAGDGIPTSVLTSTVPCVYLRPSVRINFLMAGANFGIALHTVLNIGPFDGNLPTGEDLDWAYRALRVGVPIIYVPEIVVYHVHWREKSQTAAVYRAYGWGLGAFYGKHLRRGDWSMLLRTAISLFRAVKGLIIGDLYKDYCLGVVTHLLPGLVAGLRGKNVR